MNKQNSGGLFLSQEVIPGMGSMGWTTIVFNQELADIMKAESDSYAKHQAYGRYTKTFPSSKNKNYIPRQSQ